MPPSISSHLCGPVTYSSFSPHLSSLGFVLHTAVRWHYLDSVAWSPDGKWLATASNTEVPSTIRLWRGDDSAAKILEGSTETIAAIAWHPDSKSITSISKGKGEIRHWGIDGEMGEPIAKKKPSTARDRK